MTEQSRHQETTSNDLRILIIDHHDSYTLNLLISLSEATQLSSTELLSRVVILPHNHELLATADLFKKTLLPNFDALILGPGPGHPKNEYDFGPARRILELILNKEIEIPTLGICLGHQGIAHVCGGKVVEGDSLRHGQVSMIEIADLSNHNLAWPSLFDKRELSMIRYNSLTIEEKTLPEELIVTAWSRDYASKTPTPRLNQFSPSQGTSEKTTSCSDTPDSVVMALQHRYLPLWGVQFHPESIESQDGSRILKQFVNNCTDFWKHHQSVKADVREIGSPLRYDLLRRPRFPLPAWVRALGCPLVSSCSLPDTVAKFTPASTNCLRVKAQRLRSNQGRDCDTFQIFESAFARQNDADQSEIWLDSSRKGDPQSQFSYMSIPSWQLKYNQTCRQVTISNQNCQTLSSFILSEDKKVTKSVVNVKYGLATPKASRSNSPESIEATSEIDYWSWMAALQGSVQSSTLIDSIDGAPSFTTGFVGFFDYEMKSESLTRGKEPIDQINSKQNHKQQENGLPSAWFAFCDRVLAYDHQAEQWWAICLVRGRGDSLKGKEIERVERILNESNISIGMTSADSTEWITSMQVKLDAGVEKSPINKGAILPPLAPLDSVSMYQNKIEAARAYIRKGESYELCLTTQFTGKLESNSSKDTFELYKSLRQKNPAPYSAYLNLGNGQFILSTSPERFMRIGADDKVEMRPIKGTLARAGYGKGEEFIRAAKDIGDREGTIWCEKEDERRRKTLNCDPKERAENLMIVDLIRADLLSFCPPGSVDVPRLMQVESYESVHQLVTTITGQKDASISSIQALKRCFPPGSMTGAPKVRSVDILEKLEQRKRGTYSGILGWLGVDGAASTSVIIRTVVLDGKNVSVGAGGAITYLSNAEKEWQEVLDKVKAIANIEM